jgi:tetratricopeptide (TPR) repeat protein
MTSRHRESAFLFVLLLLPVVVLSAQSPVGSIRDLYLDVEIDAFGSGDFIEAVPGEALYRESVIRTGYESWAYLTVDGESRSVGPLSVTPVDTFLNTRRRGKGEGFFSRLLQQLTRSLAPPEEEEIVAGGRAAEVEGPTTSWVFELDADELYRDALGYLDAGDYDLAVESLRLIDFPDEGDFSIEDYYVNLSYALMGIGDFYAAMEASFAYGRAEPNPSEVGVLTPRLQLLAGLSAFYVGDDRVAASALDAYLERVPLAEAAPDAVVARISLLRNSGAPAQANRLLAEAREAQPDVGWTELLAN